MIRRASCLSLILLASCLPAYASKIVPLDLDKLTPQSELIAVGVVLAITESDAASDTVSVRVISMIKGDTEAKSFSLRLRNKGVRDFDPKLAVGDQGVFFMKSIEKGRAKLTYWGSIAVVSKNGNFRISEEVLDPFREYKGKEPIPEGLREAYTGFVRAAKGGSVAAYLLPNAVKISRDPRPKASREYGEEINEDFLKNGFSPLICSVHKDADDCYLIRTNSTAIWFVQSKSGAWKVYRYSDMPID